MNIKVYHRKYPETDWDYRAVSTIFDGNEIIYYHLFNERKHSIGIEVFRGRNYIVGDNRRSYSNKYDLDRIPKKYRNIVSNLAIEFNRIKWSKANKVNLN